MLAHGIPLEKTGQEGDVIGYSIERYLEYMLSRRDEKVGNRDGNGEENEKFSLNKSRVIDHVHLDKSEEVYASISTSLMKSDFKETYSYRDIPLGRN